MSTLQSSLITNTLGDTPSDIVLSSIIIVVLGMFAWRFVVKPAIMVIMSLRMRMKSKNSILGALEIIPPKHSEISPEETQDLISIVQQQLGSYNTVSLEITASKKTGIRFRVVALENQIDSIQKHFASHLPELRFKQVPIDSQEDATASVFGVGLSMPYAYPLKSHGDLSKADPISYITGAMTHLEADEQMTLQLVLRRYSSRTATKMHNQILRKGYTEIKGTLLQQVLSRYLLWGPALFMWIVTSKWEFGVVTAFVMWLVLRRGRNKAVTLTPHLEEIYAGVANKLAQPLMQTDIRLAVSSPARTNKLVADFMSALEPHHAHGFQYLTFHRDRFGSWPADHRAQLFARRQSSILSVYSSVLSMSELASLFHFPQGVIRTEGMVRSHSRTLPAPISMHRSDDFDVTIGVNKHHGSETPIGLTASERERHMFVVGGTGSGKTTMLKYQIIQDIENGKGLTVVDPHGDLVEELLEYIPEERKKDFIYLSPDDLDHPIGVNLLELPEGLSGNDLLREKDRITESVISVMRKVFSDDDSGGHRIEYVLRNTIQTALTLKGPTLFTIFRLLNDGKFARDAIKNLEDTDLKAFWTNEIGKAGSMQKVKMTGGITAKIGRFLFSASARAMLEQEKSTIDFDEILDGKILLCNFSKGRLGEDTSMLFGVTILAKLQLAALKRSEKKQPDRRPFYLYVDEFQNFATLSFTQMLSEARKYKVFLTMAEQSTQQQNDQKMVDIILANVGTVVTFRTGSPKDEELLLPLFEPYIERGEISNLSAYNFYCRISGIETQEPMSGETVVGT